MTDKTLSLEFWKELLNTFLGDPAAMIENPALVFTAKVKAGGYDAISDEEYEALLEECERESKLWKALPKRAAGEILTDALSSVHVTGTVRLRFAQILSRCRVEDDPDGNAGSPAGGNTPFPAGGKANTPKVITSEDGKTQMTLDGIRSVRRRIDAPGQRSHRFIDMVDEENGRDGAGLFAWSPKHIYDILGQRVLGQDEARKAAAMVVYNHVAGIRSNTVFCGPTGSGKSEIWRALANEYPRLIRMFDASRLSADGWKGSLHLRDIFDGLPERTLTTGGLIVVLDEADKSLCETIIGSGGTDHSALIQNSLLKMLDGDVLEFGDEDSRIRSFRVDCRRVSVVLLGAFEKLLEKKGRRASGIGFGADTRKSFDYGSYRITADDLIAAGMRREIAGRINRIVSLSPLTADDYERILTGPVLTDLEAQSGITIGIDETSVRRLAEEAVSSGLGVRYMRSKVMNALDDLIFEDPEAREFRLRFA